MQEFGINQNKVIVFCDKHNVIHLSNHHAYHERSKYIDVKLYLIRDLIEEEEVVVENIETSVNAADSFTKALPTLKFELCSSLIGLN